MSIETRIQAINDHLIDDYKVLRLAGADLTGVNKNIVNLKMSWKERLLYFMNNGTQEVWNNWNKVSGTGTTLSLNNTEEAPMSLVYKGNTSQNGTPTPTSPIPVQVVSGDNSIEVCGKNLFNSNVEVNSTFTSSVATALQTFKTTGQYATGYCNKDNVITTYAVYQTCFVKVAENTNYYLSSQAEESNGFSSIIILDDSGNSLFASGNWIGGGYSFTTSSNAKYVMFGTRVSNIDYIQLEVGTLRTDLSPYESNSYPISLGNKELCKIGTYQDKIDKSSGKNLLNEEFTQMSANAIKCELLNFPSGTYTWSFSNNTLPGEIQVKTKVNGTYQTYVSAYSTNQLTFTLNTSQDIQLESYRVGGNPLSAYNQIMLNEGSTALPYEPYGTGWYLKKEIGKIIYNGTETGWALGGSNLSNDTCKCFYRSGLNSDYVLSNRFTYIGLSSFYYNVGKFFTNKTGYIYFNVSPSIASDVNGFKTWLSSNNIEVRYVLATPTYETITDTTLIRQLEEAKKSYESQTNISQINNDLPFELSVTALEVMS